MSREEDEKRKARSDWRKRLLDRTKKKEQSFEKRMKEKRNARRAKAQSQEEVEKKNKIIKPFGGNVVENYIKKLHKAYKDKNPKKEEKNASKK